MGETEPDGEGHTSAGRALRELLLFQLKLALDALRDFALSPISIVAFVVDAIRKPPPEKSLNSRLMQLGRRSDRVINLFGEYDDRPHYTVDQTFSEVEQALHKEWKKEQERQEKLPRQ